MARVYHSTAIQIPLFPVYSVYALIDPTDQSIRYIGMSERPDVRLTEHLGHGSYGRKRRWIQGLQAQGLLPLLKIIETTDDKQHAFERERYWTHFYAQKMPLLNGALHIHEKRRR